jgi:Ca2+/Na+ antiporter
LLTSLSAALAGALGIATGNVVGSNIANILLILGLTALLRPMVLARDVLLRGRDCDGTRQRRHGTYAAVRQCGAD